VLAQLSVDASSASHEATEEIAKNAGKPISKKQLKKQAKLQQQKERICQIKKERKEKHEREVEERRRKQAEQYGQMTEEERAESRKRKADAIESQLEEKRQKKERLEESMKTGIRVAIDLNFQDLMPNEREHKSLCQQILFSYGVNRRAKNPFRMYLTSFNGPVADRVKNQAGFEKWSISTEERPYHQVFEKKEIVYLTADSEKVLTEFDPSKVYIIGGLIDHNRHKGLTSSKALALGIETARLPLDQHVFLSSSQVLAVNQVYAILSHFQDYHDWQGAFTSVIPQRKNPLPKSAKDTRPDVPF